MTETETTSPWRRFWNKGGWWRSLLVVVGYYVLWQLASAVFIPLVMTADDPASEIWYGTALPVALGGVILVVFAWTTGWLRELFGPQPIRGSGWMWIAPVVALFFSVMHFAGTDYAKAGPSVVIAYLAAGLFIGFAEETLTRGLVVNLMRKGGYREIAVAAVSAALFAALHSGNLLSGQSPLATGFQLIYTFGFGVLMYLTLRVTGNLIWPILLHASTDPSTFLQVSYPADGASALIAGFGNPLVAILGIVLLFFVRGKVTTDEPTFDAKPA